MATSENSDVRVPAGSRFRWWPAPLLVGVSTSILVGVWFLHEDNYTTRAYWAYLVGFSTLLLLLVWWGAFSGLSGRVRLQGFAGLVAGFLAFFALVRVDGFTGEVWPIFSFRWQESPKARALRLMPASSGVPTAETIVAGQGDWPEFRGHRRDGVVLDCRLETDWAASPPQVRWRHPVGAGWSSFAVVGRRAWTMEQRGEDEAVVCYNFDTGAEIWCHRYPAHYTGPPSGEGPRATPTFFENEIHSLGGTGLLTRLRADTGERIWQKDTLEEAGAPILPWGMANSPLVYRDDRGKGPYVVVNPGGRHASSVVAYGPGSWRAGTAVAGYASPQLVTLAGRKQVMVFDGEGLAGYEPATGKQLWRHPFRNGTSINCAQPIVLEGSRVFASTGYSLGSVLLKIDEAAKPTVIWESNQMRCKFNTPVVLNGFIYGLDEGLLACLDLNSGKRLWKKGRYGYGQVLRVDDLLLVQSEQGMIFLVRVTPEGPTELAKLAVLDGQAWNEPVLCRGRLLVRNNAEAVCLDLPLAAK